MASVAILTLSAASARAFTNYLANPGVETGALAPWRDNAWLNANDAGFPQHNVSSTNGYVNGSGTIHEPARSGVYSLKVWGTYWGAGYWQEHTLSQWVPAGPASVWSADVWGYTATPDDLHSHGTNYALLEVLFCDAASNMLATAYSDVISATNSPVNTWIHLVATDSVDGTTNLVAPDGTAWVRFCLPFWQDPNWGGGSVYWDDANLIKTASTDPEISAPPRDQTLVYGQTATFTVTASGRTTLHYAWQKDSNPISDGGRVSGATTATLTISNAVSADQGAYTVTVTDNAGSLTSSAGNLTVLDPGIVSYPVSLQRIEGQSATFTVVALGSGTLTYTWYGNTAGQLSNGGRISGADTPTLTISNLTVADSDAYYVSVSGASTATTMLTPANLYVTSQAQASQLMKDPGFESVTTLDPYWTHWNGAGVVTVTSGGEPIYDGSYCSAIWGTGAGSWNGINQSFIPVPGYLYKASAWFLVSSGGPIADNGTGWIEINFYYQGNLMNSFKSALLSSNSVVGVWTNLVVPPVTPPAGADEVRCQVNWNAGSGGGLIYVDDVNFWLRIPVTITPSVSGTNLLLSFPTQVGVTNQILYKDDLGEANWHWLQDVVGDLSGQANVPTPKNLARRFYRVSTLW